MNQVLDITSTYEESSNEQATTAAAWSDVMSTASVMDPFIAMPPDANQIDSYQLFAGEMSDPSTFENITLDYLNGDGMLF